MYRTIKTTLRDTETKTACDTFDPSTVRVFLPSYIYIYIYIYTCISWLIVDERSIVLRFYLLLLINRSTTWKIIKKKRRRKRKKKERERRRNYMCVHVHICNRVHFDKTCVTCVIQDWTIFLNSSSVFSKCRCQYNLFNYVKACFFLRSKSTRSKNEEPNVFFLFTGKTSLS